MREGLQTGKSAVEGDIGDRLVAKIDQIVRGAFETDSRQKLERRFIEMRSEDAGEVKNARHFDALKPPYSWQKATKLLLGSIVHWPVALRT